MLLGTLFFSLFRSFLYVFTTVIADPLHIIKIAFLWFCVSIAVTYGYFLWSHQEYMHKIRNDLALSLLKSVWYGFLMIIALIGLYEFILRMLCSSYFFQHSASQICHLSLTQSDEVRFLRILGGGLIVLSTLWACFLIEPYLKQWHQKHVVDWYAWFMIFAGLICIMFLFMTVY